MTNIALIAALTVSLIPLPTLTPAQKLENILSSHLDRLPLDQRAAALDALSRAIPPSTRIDPRPAPPDLDLLLLELTRISSRLSDIEYHTRRTALLRQYHIYDPIDNPHPYRY